MADTTHLTLPELSAAQSQKHVTHNEALKILDAVVQLSVLDRSLTAPPGLPSNGDRYLVASGATGAWAGKDLNIATYLDGAWTFFPANLGWLCWVEDEAALLVYKGAPDYWVNFATAAALVSVIGLGDGTILKVGVNTAADNTNRLAVKSDGVLLSHDDVTPGTGDMRVIVNKSIASKDAGFTFQTAFSTRALFGLLADDHWTVKTSPDGAAFKTAIVANKDTGAVTLTQHPKFSAYVNFDSYIGANVWTDIGMNSTRHNDHSAFNAISGQFTAPHSGYYAFGAGYRFKANAAVPTAIRVGLSVNAVAATADATGTAGDATIVTLETFVQVTAMLKLAAGDTVEAQAFMATNDGYVEANSNFFWGYEIP